MTKVKKPQPSVSEIVGLYQRSVERTIHSQKDVLQDLFEQLSDCTQIRNPSILKDFYKRSFVSIGLTKEARYEEALENLQRQRARIYRQKNKLSRAICETLFFPILSFYHYKIKNYVKAELYLEKTLRHHETLVETLPLFNFHRLTIMRNRIELAFRSSEWHMLDDLLAEAQMYIDLTYKTFQHQANYLSILESSQEVIFTSLVKFSLTKNNFLEHLLKIDESKGFAVNANSSSIKNCFILWLDFHRRKDFEFERILEFANQFHSPNHFLYTLSLLIKAQERNDWPPDQLAFMKNLLDKNPLLIK